MHRQLIYFWQVLSLGLLVYACGRPKAPTPPGSAGGDAERQPVIEWQWPCEDGVALPEAEGLQPVLTFVGAGPHAIAVEELAGRGVVVRGRACARSVPAYDRDIIVMLDQSAAVEDLDGRRDDGGCNRLDAVGQLADYLLAAAGPVRIGLVSTSANVVETSDGLYDSKQVLYDSILGRSNHASIEELVCNNFGGPSLEKGFTEVTWLFDNLARKDSVKEVYVIRAQQTEPTEAVVAAANKLKDSRAVVGDAIFTGESPNSTLASRAANGVAVQTNLASSADLAATLIELTTNRYVNTLFKYRLSGGEKSVWTAFDIARFVNPADQTFTLPALNTEGYSEYRGIDVKFEHKDRHNAKDATIAGKMTWEVESSE